VVRGPWRWVFNHTDETRLVAIAGESVEVSAQGVTRLPAS
jgi:hypothetical protein